jgi:molecular chaperone GrpE
MGMARALEAVLPSLDALTASLKTEAAGHDAEAWRAGLEKIYRQLLDALEKLGLTAIAPAPGEPLDPRFHEVMLAQPSADTPVDSILQVYQTGYKLKDRLLRPAKVVVAAAPAQPEPEREN